MVVYEVNMFAILFVELLFELFLFFLVYYSNFDNYLFQNFSLNWKGIKQHLYNYFIYKPKLSFLMGSLDPKYILRNIMPRKVNPTSLASFLT